MKVEIENSTNLGELRLNKQLEVQLPDRSDVGDLLSRLGLDRLEERDGSISSLVMKFRNKESVRSVDVELSDGGRIKIMPLASDG